MSSSNKMTTQSKKMMNPETVGMRLWKGSMGPRTLKIPTAQESEAFLEELKLIKELHKEHEKFSSSLEDSKILSDQSDHSGSDEDLESGSIGSGSGSYSGDYDYGSYDSEGDSEDDSEGDSEDQIPIVSKSKKSDKQSLIPHPAKCISRKMKK